MQTAPAISVIMSVYNDAQFLGEAVHSICDQSFPDFEFLIVNDGSSDGSAAILDNFAASDSRIRVYHRANHGLIASLNYLIEEARAPLLARMDGDDISLPLRLETQFTFLQAHHDILALGCNINDIDTRGRIAASAETNPITPDAVRDRLAVKSALCHPSVMMRRDAVRQVGGYRAAYRHCEDYDLWLRLVEYGDLANLEQRLLLYRRSAGQVSKKHAFAQTFGATLARLAHHERQAGRADPFCGMDELPNIDQLDACLDRTGVSDQVRAEMVPQIIYSREALAGEGLALIQTHVRRGGATDGLWRTVARLVKFGLIGPATRLTTTLIAASK